MKKEVPQIKIKNPVLRFLTLASASGLGLGYAPFAPGTAGSLLGIPLGLWLLKYSIFYSVGFLLILTLFFSWVSQKAGDHWGERDSSKIVIDEVIGQALSLLGLWVLAHPVNANFNFQEYNLLEIMSTNPAQWFWMIFIGFLLFRAFDITKPFPARTLDRHNSGLGVMGDDIVAGIYAAVILRFIVRIWIL